MQRQRPPVYLPPRPWWERQETKDRITTLRELIPTGLIILAVLLFVGIVATVLLQDHH